MIGGFSKIIGLYISLVAELWDVLEGLKLYIRSSYEKIELQIDSKIILEAVKSRKQIIKEGSGILHQIKEYLNDNWEC